MKVNWLEPTKIDIIRHAQTGVFNQAIKNQVQYNRKTLIKTMPSRAMLKHQGHENKGIFYKHVCSLCYQNGKETDICRRILDPSPVEVTVP